MEDELGPISDQDIESMSSIAEILADYITDIEYHKVFGKYLWWPLNKKPS